MLMFNITTFIAVVIRILKIHMSLIFSMNCFNVETAFIMVCRQAAGRCSCCDFESLRHTSSGMRAPQCESRGRRNPSVLVPVWHLSTREKSIQGAMPACGRDWVPLCWVFFWVPPVTMAGASCAVLWGAGCFQSPRRRANAWLSLGHLRRIRR